MKHELLYFSELLKNTYIHMEAKIFFFFLKHLFLFWTGWAISLDSYQADLKKNIKNKTSKIAYTRIRGRRNNAE